MNAGLRNPRRSVMICVVMMALGGAALLLGIAMALLAWRSAIGGWNAWTSQSGSMMLGFPEWIVYCGIVPPLALTAAIGFAQALRGFGREVSE